MIIWKPLFGEFLLCMKEPTNEAEMNVAVVCTTSNCTEEMVGHVQQNLHECIRVSIPAPLCFGYLYNQETCQSCNVNFHFYGSEKTI